MHTVKPINIRETVGLKDGEDSAIKEKHLVITVVEELKKKAIELNFDFCTYNGQSYFYNGNYWTLVGSEELKQLLRNFAYMLGIDKYTSKHYNFAENLLKQYLVSTIIEKKQDDGITKINLQNGTFEFSNNPQLTSFNKSDFIRYQLPFNYDSNEKAPLFEAYLNKVLPDLDCQNILAEYIGYVFTKGHKQEKCMLLYGGGANGKSVFFNIISALLGKENITNCTLRELGNPNSRALINNKLLNYSSEIDASINKDTFKQLVSGEPLQAKALYKDVYIIDNYAKLIFNCNELPKDVEYTEGFFRRWLIIPFTQTILACEQDKNLASKIIQVELSGVFNWVLLGLQRLIEQGQFTQSNMIDNCLNDFKQETDSVYQFVSHCNYKPSKTHKKGMLELYKTYTTFCNENGFKSPNIENFGKRLVIHGFTIKRERHGNFVWLEEAGNSTRNKENYLFSDDDLDELPF